MTTIRLEKTDNPQGLVGLVEKLPSSFDEPERYEIEFTGGYLYS